MANLFEVLSVIRREGRVTRKQIQKHTGLSWGGVSQIVTRLSDLGYIAESKGSAPSHGRTPMYLSVDPDTHCAVGIDVNLSGLHTTVINLKNEIRAEYDAPADVRGKDAFLRSVDEALAAAVKKAPRVVTIGVAMQGEVDAEAGVSRRLSLPDWQDVPLSAMLTERFGVPVYLAHDPDCLLHAAFSGTQEDALLFRADNGIGLAVMKNGMMLSAAGMLEAGRMIAPEEGNKSLGTLLKSDEAAFCRAFAAAAVNTAVLFAVGRVFYCGTYFDGHPGAAEAINRRIAELSGRPPMEPFDVRRASEGAAIYALKEHLQYIK